MAHTTYPPQALQVAFSWTTPAAANPSLGPLKWPPEQGCKPTGLNVGHEACRQDPLGSWHMDMQEIGNSHSQNFFFI